MATIIDSLRESVSPTILSALSRQTGESAAAVSRGLSAAIPAIASTIAGRAGDQGFVKDLLDLSTTTATGPHPFEAISAFASSPTGIDTANPIGIDTTNPFRGWLGDLFGHNLSAVTDSIARYAGIGRGSATSLLSIAAPLVLGYIGRLVQSENLSAAGLADLLRGQRSDGREHGEDRPVGSARRAAGGSLCRWTDLVGPPEARRSGSCGRH